MVKTKLREIYLISILILLPLNIIDGFLKPYVWYDWILYTVPFVGLFLFIALTKNLKIDAVILGVAALGCILAGDKGNLTGATFLYLFCYSWENPRLSVFFGVCSVLIIWLKFVIVGYTYFEYLKYLYGYYFICSILFLLTWRFSRVIIKTVKADRTNKQILAHLKAGSTVKTIAHASAAWDWLDNPLTENAVGKRIRKMMNGISVNNLFQFGYELGKKDGIKKPY